MIDLQELRQAAEWLNKEWNSLPEDANIMDFEDRKIQMVPSRFIELLDRLEAAEKVCGYVYQNTGMHCSAVGKCIICNKNSTRALDMVCDRCIYDALAAWQKVKEASNDV